MNDQDRVFLQPRVLVPFTLTTLIWGSTWLVITGQLGVVPPAWSVTYRFAIAAVALLAYARVTGASLRIGRNGHILAIAIGILQFCLNFNFVYIAEQYVTSGLVAVVFAMLLVPNSLLARIFLDHRLSGRFLAGSAVAVAGVALLFVHELRASGGRSDAVLTGIGVAVLGVISVSVANVLQAAERVRARAIVPLITWAMTYAVGANAVIAWVAFGAPVFERSFVYIAGLVYLGLVASALAFTLYFGILRAIGPGRAAYSGLIIPIIAMLLSTLFEGYAWSWLAVAGGLLSIFGLFIALRARRAEAASG